MQAYGNFFLEKCESLKYKVFQTQMYKKITLTWLRPDAC